MKPETAEKKKKYLPIGTKVRVRRITGEEAEGVVAKGPLDFLIKIGEFYIIARKRPEDDENAHYYSGHGRKSKARLEYEARVGVIGMYEREYIRT